MNRETKQEWSKPTSISAHPRMPLYSEQMYSGLASCQHRQARRRQTCEGRSGQFRDHVIKLLHKNSPACQGSSFLSNASQPGQWPTIKSKLMSSNKLTGVHHASSNWPGSGASSATGTNRNKSNLSETESYSHRREPVLVVASHLSETFHTWNRYEKSNSERMVSRLPAVSFLLNVYGSALQPHASNCCKIDLTKIQSLPPPLVYQLLRMAKDGCPANSKEHGGKVQTADWGQQRPVYSTSKICGVWQGIPCEQKFGNTNCSSIRLTSSFHWGCDSHSIQVLQDTLQSEEMQR